MDNQAFDPLIDRLMSRLNKKAEAKSTSAETESKADDQPQPQPSAEALLNTSVALNLHDVAAAGWLYWIVSSTVPDRINPEAFKQYRDILIETAGNPSDPIEIMLIEQLALAHFSIGRLQIKACSIDNAKLSVAYSDAATRLLGEFRRCSLALEDYRAKQIARKDWCGSIDAAENEAPTARNGKPRPSTNGNGTTNGKASANGKKTAVDSKLATNEEVPECIRQRMGYTTKDASRQTVEISGNGKG